MSKVISGVIDLPHVDLTDINSVYETILFLQENKLFSSEWLVEKRKDCIFLKHAKLDWTWIKISTTGKIEYDNHYGVTEEAKDQLLELINKYFPMVKKTTEIIRHLNLKNNCRMTFNKEKEQILIEIIE